MKTVEKVFAYITNRGRLLVFEQPEFPEAGLQVPAGTLEPGETTASGVVREAEEETGLSAFAGRTFLGMEDFDQRLYGRKELHRRHFFHLPVAGRLPERWTHYERSPAGPAHDPIAFAFRWLPLAQASRALGWGHAALLPALERALAADSQRVNAR